MQIDLFSSMDSLVKDHILWDQRNFFNSYICSSNNVVIERFQVTVSTVHYVIVCLNQPPWLQKYNIPPSYCSVHSTH